ncbi:hypothetical protein HPB49_026390 [Dermacentor silvarum]|nr:hypothetical protein HPB49_026390 [Dermacentor silvarum]
MATAPTPRHRAVVLVDMDCFYVQVEQRLAPDWNGKPCAVAQYNTFQGGGCATRNFASLLWTSGSLIRATTLGCGSIIHCVRASPHNCSLASLCLYALLSRCRPLCRDGEPGDGLFDPSQHLK